MEAVCVIGSDDMHANGGNEVVIFFKYVATNEYIEVISY